MGWGDDQEAVAAMLVVLLLFGVGAWQYRAVLTAYASFFTVNTPTKGADAIIVLSGGPATRIPRGLELFREGYAARIFLTDEKKSSLGYRLRGT